MSVGVNGANQPPDDAVFATGRDGPKLKPIGGETIAAPVEWVKPLGTRLEIDVAKGCDIKYFRAEDAVGDSAWNGKLVVFLDNNKQVHLGQDELAKIVLDMQGHHRKRHRDVDAMAPEDLLDDIRDYQEPEHAPVQVLDGGNDVTLADFNCSTARGVAELMHYIEASALQETAPWSAVWNLHRCLMLALGKG